MLSRDQIAELRREIEAIQERNAHYRARKGHSYRDRAAHERRKIGLKRSNRNSAIALNESLLRCPRPQKGVLAAGSTGPSFELSFRLPLLYQENSADTEKHFSPLVHLILAGGLRNLGRSASTGA
jgi:hypothetical protein